MEFTNRAIRFYFGDGKIGQFFANLVGASYYDIYYYALIITLGMVCCIIIASYNFKRKGLLSDHSLDYAIIVIPLAVIGCRIYFLLFPYAGITWSQFEASWTWENFWDIRNGGLGIYGGVIVGYVVAFIVTKVKRLKFYEVGDCIIPGLMFAQALGRWGNFFNQEAYGNLVSNPNFQWFPYAVQIGSEWYQATFFYESIATLIGFILCMVLLKNKHYRDGWCMVVYGLYYGTVRLIIEGLRADSLFLRVPLFWSKTFWETGIRVSQLVSVVIMVLAVVRLVVIYKKEILAFFQKRKKVKGR